jgi:tetratricopeptide (TPR) repeat protein
MTPRSRRSLRIALITVAGLILLFLLHEVIFRREVITHSLASGAYGRGAYGLAERLWNSLADKDDGDPIPESSLGKLAYRKDDFREAEKQFSAAVTEQKGKAGLHYDKGNSSFKLDDLDHALEEYKQAMLLDPDDQDAKANYELVLRRKGYQPPPPPQDEGQKPDEAKPEETRPEESKPDYKNTLDALDQQEAQDRQQNQPPPKAAPKDKWW